MDTENMTNSEKAELISKKIFGGLTYPEGIEKTLESCKGMKRYEVESEVKRNFPLLSETGVVSMATAIFLIGNF